MLKRLVKISGLAIVGVGVFLVAAYLLQTFNGYSSEATVDEPDAAPATVETRGVSTDAPEDETLRLTVPKANVESATIPTSEPTEAALRDNVAVRLPGTGLPWQEGSNVYIAGHELGYPLTDSFRAFYDLKTAKKGDKFYITDANGTEYTYEVFEIRIVQPEDLWVLEPVQGKTIASLQVSETDQKEGDVTPKRVVRGELIETS